MSLIDNLNILQTNIEKEKEKLLKNLSNKGITVQPSNNFIGMSNTIKNIGLDGVSWKDAGYDEEPKPIADKHKLIAQWYSEWNPSNTVLDNTFANKHPECDIFPKIDASNVISVNNVDCSIFKGNIDFSEIISNKIVYLRCINLGINSDCLEIHLEKLPQLGIYPEGTSFEYTKKDMLHYLLYNLVNRNKYEKCKLYLKKEQFDKWITRKENIQIPSHGTVSTTIKGIANIWDYQVTNKGYIFVKV